MPTKTIKTQGRVAKAAKTQPKTKVAVRANGDTTTGLVTEAPARKTTAAPTISTEDIALRAYFVNQSRCAAGLPGDDLGDWVQAERELLAEAAK